MSAIRPNKAQFIELMGSPDEGPVVMLNLLKFKERADGAGGSGAMKRARPSPVKNLPAEKKRRSLRASPLRAGHITGSSASYASSESDASAPISKSRLPLFSNADKAACSRNTSAAPP